MASQREERQRRGQTTCAIDVSPDVVDAGRAMTLHATVSCSPACDLRGHTLLIKDHAGADAGSVELTEFDGNAHTAGELVVKAPAAPGEYTWVAVCPSVVKDEVSYAETSTPIPFVVKPHATSVVVWEIPSAVVASEKFRIKVGIKCSSECGFANSRFGVYDHEGARIATGTLPGDRWPGTTGLYVAEVELDAPAGEGLYTWTVRAPEGGVGIAHADGSSSFGVRVVSRPDHLVVVEAIDKESQTPLAGARVVMHPYKAVTDERGIAEVRVAKGTYKLFVSQTRYLTFGLPVEVDTDMRTRAELSLEPVPERN